MNRRLVKLADPEARIWRADYDTFSPRQRVFRVVWELEAEANNAYP
jgi:hypothetical protein